MNDKTGKKSRISGKPFLGLERRSQKERERSKESKAKVLVSTLRFKHLGDYFEWEAKACAVFHVLSFQEPCSVLCQQESRNGNVASLKQRGVRSPRAAHS